MAQRRQDCGFSFKDVFKERKIPFSRRVVGYQDGFGSHPAPSPAELPRREPALSQVCKVCKDRAPPGRSELSEKSYLCEAPVHIYFLKSNKGSHCHACAGPRRRNVRAQAGVLGWLQAQDRAPPPVCACGRKSERAEGQSASRGC